MRWPSRSDDHDFSQRHLSHYLDGDLSARARRRLERHAAECPDCSQGIRAMKALLRLIGRIDPPDELQAPVSVFDRVRVAAIASPAEPQRGPER